MISENRYNQLVNFSETRQHEVASGFIKELRSAGFIVESGKRVKLDGKFCVTYSLTEKALHGIADYKSFLQEVENSPYKIGDSVVIETTEGVKETVKVHHFGRSATGSFKIFVHYSRGVTGRYPEEITPVIAANPEPASVTENEIAQDETPVAADKYAIGTRVKVTAHPRENEAGTITGYAEPQHNGLTYDYRVKHDSDGRELGWDHDELTPLTDELSAAELDVLRRVSHSMIWVGEFASNAPYESICSKGLIEVGDTRIGTSKGTQYRITPAGREALRLQDAPTATVAPVDDKADIMRKLSNIMLDMTLYGQDELHGVNEKPITWLLHQLDVARGLLKQL